MISEAEPTEAELVAIWNQSPRDRVLLLREVEELRRDWSFVATALEVAEARIEELRAALREVETYSNDPYVVKIARAALGEK